MSSSDHDRLVALTGQHQHTGSFLGKGPGSEIPNPRRREFQLARIVRAHHYTPADAVPCANVAEGRENPGKI